VPRDPQVEEQHFIKLFGAPSNRNGLPVPVPEAQMPEPKKKELPNYIDFNTIAERVEMGYQDMLFKLCKYTPSL
jgi:hypothetical protein